MEEEAYNTVSPSEEGAKQARRKQLSTSGCVFLCALTKVWG